MQCFKDSVVSNYKFHLRLEEDEFDRDLFEAITNRFVELCGTSLKKQQTNSFLIHGWLKTLRRYGLFQETIRVFLAELKKKTGDVFDEIAGKLSKQYLQKNAYSGERSRWTFNSSRKNYYLYSTSLIYNQEKLKR